VRAEQLVRAVDDVEAHHVQNRGGAANPAILASMVATALGLAYDSVSASLPPLRAT
jgi:hypothetical protein